MSIAPSIDRSSIDVLVFEIAECRASGPMREAAERWCEDRAIRLVAIDVWTDPAAVVEHRILIGPTILVLADGEEIGRLAGPANRRRVDRFFGKVTTPVERPLPTLLAVA